MNKILLGVLYCIFGQIFVWFQINVQFFWTNSSKYYWPIIVLGGTITSLFFMNGVKNIVDGFDGQLWPSRMIPTATGMFVYSVLSWFCLKQGIDIKTGVCLLLALVILIIQLYWK